MKSARLLFLLLVLTLLALFLTNSVHANRINEMASPSYRLDWLVPLSGGGGEAQSAHYAVHLTVGQTVVGTASGSNFHAKLGYWYGVLQDWWVHLPLVIR